MEKLPISVITITKNEEKTIEDTLISVQRNNPAEVIVVDGDSTDRTVEIARRYTQRIYCDEGGGRSGARQLGAEMATQEYIAYVDSAVTLAEGALATMLGELQASDYISIHAQFSTFGRHPNYWQRAQFQHHQLSHPERHMGLATSLFRRETILKYGFELGYGGQNDDVDLELRLKKDGHKFGTSSALFYHDSIADFGSLVKYRFFLGRMLPRIIQKWGPWHPGFWPLLAMLYWLGFCLIKGKPRLIPYFIINGTVQTAGMVKGFFEIMRESRRH